MNLKVLGSLMNFRLILVAGALAASLSTTDLWAGSQDELLRDVHAVLRITGAHVEWIRNSSGGFTPMAVYDMTNRTDFTVPIPATSIPPSRLGTPANWAGMCRLSVERLGPDPTIAALPKGTARRGRRYEYSASAIAWRSPFVGPHDFQRFTVPIATGGFPSGRYAVHIDYLTTHGLQLIQSEVVYLDVP